MVKHEKHSTDSQSTLDPNIHAILSAVCNDVETPQVRQPDVSYQNERLFEMLEIKNYPHTAIPCTHLIEKGISEDCVDCQQLQYQTYKERFITLSQEKGLPATHTLKAAFDYYETLITQYRLTEGDSLLDQIYPVCITRGSWSQYYIAAIQARAFLRFKQSRYQESLELFQLQLEALGPNERLYENMALVYARLGNRSEAAKSYARAILLIRQQPSAQQQMATLLMGLALVLENVDDALAVLSASLKILQERYDKPHSLMAKTYSAMGDLYDKKQDIQAAADCYEKAVQIFIDTCGYETPLTSNAMGKYARALLALKQNDKAAEMYVNALQVWVKVDNDSFDPNNVVEALIALQNECSSVEIRKALPAVLESALDALQEKIIRHPRFVNDLNVLCLLKFMSSLYIFMSNIEKAIQCCELFSNALSKLDNDQLGNLLVHKNNLLQETTQLLELLKTIKK